MPKQAASGCAGTEPSLMPKSRGHISLQNIAAKYCKKVVWPNLVAISRGQVLRPSFAAKSHGQDIRTSITRVDHYACTPAAVLLLKWGHTH